LNCWSVSAWTKAGQTARAQARSKTWKTAAKECSRGKGGRVTGRQSRPVSSPPLAKSPGITPIWQEASPVPEGSDRERLSQRQIRRASKVRVLHAVSPAEHLFYNPLGSRPRDNAGTNVTVALSMFDRPLWLAHCDEPLGAKRSLWRKRLCTLSAPASTAVVGGCPARCLGDSRLSIAPTLPLRTC
jgi:hypothetical protein